MAAHPYAAPWDWLILGALVVASIILAALVVWLWLSGRTDSR